MTASLLKRFCRTSRTLPYRLHAGGKSLGSIGQTLGRAKSSISRELRRNARPTSGWRGGYDPLRADKVAKGRRKRDKRFKLALQPDLRDQVKDSLAMGMSPEQIAGRLKRDHGHTIISHESIYRYIYHRSANKDYWHRLLPRRKSRRGKLGVRGGSPASFILNRCSITERPEDAEDRQVPGHWEADYMLFSTPGQSILVLHERQSRYTLIVRPPDRKAANTAQHLARLLQPIPKTLRKSITFDNGTEFALHYKLGVDTFFCDPHSPWQKGGVENAIGRLRRALPRKTNIDLIDPHQIQKTMQTFNDTPRKCLDFRTPNEAFSTLKSTVALQT